MLISFSQAGHRHIIETFATLFFHQNLVAEIKAHKSPVDQACLQGNQFVQDNRDRLGYEQQEDLGHKTGDLRDTYDRLDATAGDWLKQAQDDLSRLRKDRDSQVGDEL